MNKKDSCKLTWPSPGIALITLNKEEKLNALDKEMLSQWHDILLKLTNDKKKPKCIILTGAGKAFCSGADIAANFSFVTPGEKIDLGKILTEHFHPVIEATLNLPCPIISAVNGPAVGIGFTFAILSDLVFASENAYFWLNFSTLGLVPDGGSTFLLPKIIGAAKTMELILLAEKITAKKAISLGIVAKSFPQEELLEKTINQAKKIAQGPIFSQVMARKLVHCSSYQNIGSQLKLEAKAQSLCGQTSDFYNAISLFINKHTKK